MRTYTVMIGIAFIFFKIVGMDSPQNLCQLPSDIHLHIFAQCDIKDRMELCEKLRMVCTYFEQFLTSKLIQTCFAGEDPKRCIIDIINAYDVLSLRRCMRFECFPIVLDTYGPDLVKMFRLMIQQARNAKMPYKRKIRSYQLSREDAKGMTKTELQEQWQEMDAVNKKLDQVDTMVDLLHISRDDPHGNEKNSLRALMKIARDNPSRFLGIIEIAKNVGLAVCIIITAAAVTYSLYSFI